MAVMVLVVVDAIAVGVFVGLVLTKSGKANHGAGPTSDSRSRTRR